jgi:hypothetical protein
MRIAGDMDIEFNPADDTEAREQLLGWATSNILETLAVFSGQRVAVKVMFDAEEKR